MQVFFKFVKVSIVKVHEVENCSLIVQKVKNCYLFFVMVIASEAQSEPQIYEQHSDILITGFQAIDKDENNKIMKEKAPSLDSKSSLFDPKSSQLDVKDNQIGVKSSLLDPQSSLVDLKSSRLDVKDNQIGVKSSLLDPQSSPLLDLKFIESDIQAAGIHKMRDNQIERDPAHTSKFNINKNGKQVETEMQRCNHSSEPSTLGGVCLMCNKEFMNKKSLSYDKYKVHTSEGIINCPICGTSFGSKPSLKYHQIKIHLDQKLLCEHCPKFFYRKYHLVLHTMRLHNFENMVTCKTCKSDYKNEDELKRHQYNVHVMKDKFKCQNCAISLASAGSLYTHMKTVHGDRKLQCHPCGKFFGQKISFIKHNNSFHSSNSTELCSQCQKTLSLNIFSKKNRKMIDGQYVSICYYCTKRNNSNVLG